MLILTYAIAMFVLTVATIVHIYLIEVKNLKEKYKKSVGMNILIWLTVVGVLLSCPMWWLVYKTFVSF